MKIAPSFDGRVLMTMERKIIENQSFGQERALYAQRNILCKRVAIDGEEDGKARSKSAATSSARSAFSTCAIRSGTTTI